MKFVVLQFPVGGDVGGGGEGSVDEIYTAESLDTEWFYPKKEDYKKAVDEATGLQSYLEEAGYPSVCTLKFYYFVSFMPRRRYSEL